MQAHLAKGLIVLTLLFSSLEMSARTEYNNTSHSGGSKRTHQRKSDPKIIDQCLIDKACGTLTLRESGEYKVKENLVGTLVIAASSICLDLGCHTLDANGADNAIIIQGTPLASIASTRPVTPKFSFANMPLEFKNKRKLHAINDAAVKTIQEIPRPTLRTALKADVAISDIHSVKVFNGTIVGSSDAGILVDTCFDVSLFDLSMLNNAQDAIRVMRSNAIQVSRVNFLGNPAGERALLFDSSDNLTIKNVVATNYLSTTGALIEFDACHNVSMNDADLSNNTKTATADVFFFDMGTAFVGAQSCTGVHFIRVKVNNNTIANTVPVDPETNFRTFEAIEFLGCFSCSLTDCETSNNTDTAGSLATFDTEDYMLALLFCDNFITTGHQSNNNSCEQPIFYFMGALVGNSPNVVFEACQINSNRVAELVVADSFTVHGGFWITRYFDGPASENCILRNSQVNFNTVVNGGTRPTSKGQLGALYPLWILSNNTLIDHCQINNNVMESTGFSQSVVGILLDVVSDITITNSTMNNNSGGEVAAGIDLFQTTRAIVQNCAAHNNGSWGIGSDYYFFPGGPVTDATIIDCECHGNGGNAWSAGIFINGSNILVKGCDVYDTSSGVLPDSLSGDLAGIIVQNANNVVIEKSNVFNSTSTDAITPFRAHGILLDSVTNSQVLSTNVQGNQNSGLELLTTPNTPFVFTNPAVLQPLRAFYTTNGPRITSPIQGPGVIADPTNACTPLNNDLTGDIGIVLRDGSCGSATFVLNTEDAHALATLIIDITGTTTSFGGSPDQTKVAVAISQEDGEALLAALAQNPPPILILDTLPFSPNDTISLIECTAKDNGDNGFEFGGDSTVSCCLVQDCRALNNEKGGFVYDPAVTPETPFTTTFIGNEAQCNGSGTPDKNFIIANGVSLINLQELSWADGSFTSINPPAAGAAALGARYTNLRTVPSHAAPAALACGAQ